MIPTTVLMGALLVVFFLVGSALSDSIALDCAVCNRGAGQRQPGHTVQGSLDNGVPGTQTVDFLNFAPGVAAKPPRTAFHALTGKGRR